jgi:hypothetical protein
MLFGVLGSSHRRRDLGGLGFPFEYHRRTHADPLAASRGSSDMEEPAADREIESVGLRAIRALLLGCAFAFPFILMMGKSITGDEVAHIPAAYSYLRTHEIVLNPMHPPLVKELAALPLLWLRPRIPLEEEKIRDIGKREHTYQWQFGEDFLIQQDVERILFWSRLPAVLISLGLAIVVTLWATELWGTTGGLLALSLYVFDPTITAHAQLVTTDVGCAFFSTLFFYLLRRFVRAPNGSRLVACGVALGLALGAKFSAVVVVPLAALLLVMNSWSGDSGRLRRLTSVAAVFAVMCALAYVTLWALYFFPRDPLFYLKGLHDVALDHNPGYLHFFMGDFRHGSWPTYFIVALLIKTPIPELLFMTTAAVLALYGWRREWREEAFVLLPLGAMFLGYATLASPIGVRYMIPCLPFLFIASGRVGAALSRASRLGLAVAAALTLWLVAEFATIWPDHLSYFNEAAGGSRSGVEWLDDSNVDWGQGFLELRRYVQENSIQKYRLCNFGYFNPAYYGFNGDLVWLDALLDPPSPGTLILSSHCVARVKGWLGRRYGNGPENWLAHVQPRAIVGHAYWVYEIPPAREHR